MQKPLKRKMHIYKQNLLSLWKVLGQFFLTSFVFKKAAGLLSYGGVIGYPTEAVFGLGCDPLNESAVSRLLAIKNRPVHKGLIIIASHFNQLNEFIQPQSPEVIAKINKSWPGPHTWVLPASDNTPDWLTGDHEGIAVRVTAHPIAALLCEEFGGPLVSTSANKMGRTACRTTTQMRLRFWNELDLIVPGEIQNSGRPTEIKNALNDEVFRSG